MGVPECVGCLECCGIGTEWSESVGVLFRAGGLGLAVRAWHQSKAHDSERDRSLAYCAACFAHADELVCQHSADVSMVLLLEACACTTVPVCTLRLIWH
jgi:hypothetical protein